MRSSWLYISTLAGCHDHQVTRLDGASLNSITIVIVCQVKLPEVIKAPNSLFKFFEVNQTKTRLLTV